MKKYLYLLLMCLSGISSYAQYITGDPPNIEWMKTDLWPERPLFYYTAPSPFTIPDSASGDDWFLSLKLRHDLSNQPTNYVCAGYSTEPKLWQYTYDSLVAKGGCGYFTSSEPCNRLRLTSVAGLNAVNHIIVRGLDMPSIALPDLNGDIDSSVYKKFPTIGEFNNAIPTKDGGYLAVGWTTISSKFNAVNGQVQGLSHFLYNPDTIHSPVNFDQAGNGGSCAYPSSTNLWKSLVVKYDSLLHEQWSYVYGTVAFAAGPTNPAHLESSEVHQAAECLGGGYIIVGGSGTNGSFYKKINPNGMIKWEFTHVGNRANAVVRDTSGGTEYYYIAGNDFFNSRCFVSKINTSGTVLWTIYRDPYGAGTEELFSIDLAADGNLYIAGTSTDNHGWIYKINKGTQADLYSYIDAVPLQASDLRYHLTATSDGGCAIISTVLVHPLSCTIDVFRNYTDAGGSPVASSCPRTLDNWNTDTYVAQFDATLQKKWSTAFDATTTTPSGNSPDIITGCSTFTSWQIPNQLGYDVKRAECMFGIAEAPGGGLVLAGKNSQALDDGYLVKLCASTPIYVVNETVTTVEPHQSSYAIEVLNTSIESTGTMDMKACHYVLINPGNTVFKPGSIVTASIDNTLCCTLGSSGGPSFRVADAGWGGTIIPSYDNSSSETLGNIKVSVFPNPNNGTFTLSLESTQSQTVSIDIIDSYGRSVASKKGLGVSGQLKTEINLNAFGKGIYSVKLNSGDNTLVKKVVVE
jgi:hypothetical protein